MKNFIKTSISILLLAIVLTSAISCDSSNNRTKEQREFDGYCAQCGKGYYKENAWAGQNENYIGKSENGSYCSEYCANLSVSPN